MQELAVESASRCSSLHNSTALHALYTFFAFNQNLSPLTRILDRRLSVDYPSNKQLHSQVGKPIHCQPNSSLQSILHSAVRVLVWWGVWCVCVESICVCVCVCMCVSARVFVWREYGVCVCVQPEAETLGLCGEVQGVSAE